MCRNKHTQGPAGQQSNINSSAPLGGQRIDWTRCGLSQVITVIGTLLKRVIQLCPGGEHLNSAN